MLDAMVPVFRRRASATEISSNPPRRMIAIQTNMGILSQHFFPTATGADFELTAYLDLSMLQRMGLPIDKFATSTGTMRGLDFA